MVCFQFVLVAVLGATRCRFSPVSSPSNSPLRFTCTPRHASYDSILRLFLLPHPDMRRIMFVVSLDPPVRSGSKGYPHVLIQFDQTDVGVAVLGVALGVAVGVCCCSCRWLPLPLPLSLPLP